MEEPTRRKNTNRYIRLVKKSVLAQWSNGYPTPITPFFGNGETKIQINFCIERPDSTHSEYAPLTVMVAKTKEATRRTQSVHMIVIMAVFRLYNASTLDDRSAFLRNRDACTERLAVLA